MLVDGAAVALDDAIDQLEEPADEGVHLIEEHDDMGVNGGRHEELYVLMTGLARFTIDGGVTWLLAAVIVWAAAVLAAFILPFLGLKKYLEERRA